MQKRLKRSLILLFLGYLLLLVLTASFQRQLLYKPERSSIRPEQVGLEAFKDAQLISDDGTKLQWWHYPVPNEKAPMLVYFHGNAGHLGMRANRLRAFAQQGFGVAILSYRGFGASEGKPSEAANYVDASALIEHLKDRVECERMVLYGESLGTGIAVEMATRYDVGALILQSPYTSVTDRAQELYPIFPVRYLLQDRYESLVKMADVDEPLLLFHGVRDAVIPMAHGSTLFAAAKQPKQAYLLDDIGHNDFDPVMLAERTAAFVGQYAY